MKKRKEYIDVLRVLAMIAVIVIHVSTQERGLYEIETETWFFINVCNSLSRWSVPVFFMISGVLFLDEKRELEIRTLYRRYIPRLVVAYLFWMCIYILRTIPENGFSLRAILIRLLRGEGHMWYVFAALGVYALIPICRAIVRDIRIERYFIYLFFVVSYVFPFCCNTIFLFAENLSRDELYLTFITNFERIQIAMPEGYIGFFILGHYFDRITISKRKTLIAGGVGIWSLLAMILLSYTFSVQAGVAYDGFYEYFSLCTLGTAVAVFCVCKGIKWQLQGVVGKVIKVLSKYSFGIYLSHLLVIYWLQENGISTRSCNALVSIPGLVLVVLLVSFGMSWCVGKIPILKKYVI